MGVSSVWRMMVVETCSLPAARPYAKWFVTLTAPKLFTGDLVRSPERPPGWLSAVMLVWYLRSPCHTFEMGRMPIVTRRDADVECALGTWTGFRL